jgi:hypothetical protein
VVTRHNIPIGPNERWCLPWRTKFFEGDALLLPSRSVYITNPYNPVVPVPPAWRLK